MNEQVIDQTWNLIQKSKKILLLTHARADADGLGAMISMALILKELGKQMTAVTNDPTPSFLDFLPSMGMVQNAFYTAKDFIITLDCSQTPVNKIKYNLEDNRVNIIISPKRGQFSEKDLSFAQGSEEKADLIMTFDTGNLEHLGPIYDQNADLFFKTPLINVDHHASNTEFGQVNLVDVTASSTTQLVYELLLVFEKRLSKPLISPDIATLLLAGLITDTGSFQHANTSPQAMEVAAELLDLGARQQEIIKNIYKTKKLSTLKLWGIVLSKVQVDPVYRMVWSAVSQNDFREAGADSEETGSIIDDLLTNAPGAEVIMLIKHGEDNVISVSMRSTSNQVDVGKLCAEMGGGGHVRAAGFKVRDNKPFDQVVSDVIKRVREYQAKRLNIHHEDLEQARPAAGPPRAIQKKPGQAKITPQKTEPKPANREAKQPQKVRKETVLDFKVSKPESKLPAPAPRRNFPLSDKKEEPKEEPKKDNSKPVMPPLPPAPMPSVPPAPSSPAPLSGAGARPASLPPSPSLPPAPPPPEPKPALKPEASPDVPDWLKTE